MSKILDLLSWLVTAQPVVTLVVLLAVTVGLGAGSPGSPRRLITACFCRMTAGSPLPTGR